MVGCEDRQGIYLQVASIERSTECVFVDKVTQGYAGEGEGLSRTKPHEPLKKAGVGGG